LKGKNTGKRRLEGREIEQRSSTSIGKLVQGRGPDRKENVRRTKEATEKGKKKKTNKSPEKIKATPPGDSLDEQKGTKIRPDQEMREEWGRKSS